MRPFYAVPRGTPIAQLPIARLAFALIAFALLAIGCSGAHAGSQQAAATNTTQMVSDINKAPLPPGEKQRLLDQVAKGAIKTP